MLIKTINNNYINSQYIVELGVSLRYGEYSVLAWTYKPWARKSEPFPLISGIETEEAAHKALDDLARQINEEHVFLENTWNNDYPIGVQAITNGL